MIKLVMSFMTATYIANAAFAQATTSAAPTPGVSTTTAAAPKKIKGSFTHISSRGAKADPAATRLQTINAFAISYKPEEVSYGASIKARYDLVGKEELIDSKKPELGFKKQRDAKTDFSDLKLNATKSIGSLGSSDAATLKGTFYLPTSNNSKITNQYSAIGAELYIPYTLTNGFSTQLVILPIFKFIKGDDKFFNETFGEIRYAFTDKVSTYAGVYHDFYGTAGEATKRYKEEVSPELGVDVSFPEIVDLTFAATQTRNVLNPTESEETVRKSYALFAPEETSYSVQAVFQF
jgi:hypothetical protein